MSNGISNLTWGDLKQYAVDGLQDSTGDKATRQATRACRRALRRLATEHDWSFLRKWLRINLLGEYSFATGGFALSVDALDATAKMVSATIASLRTAVLVDGSSVDEWTLYFSGSAGLGSRFHRLSHTLADDASNPGRVVMHSTDPFVGSNADTFQGDGVYLQRDRYLLPRWFKNIYGEPQQQDFLARMTEITPEEMVYRKKSYSRNSQDPVMYSLQTHHLRQQKELVLWPVPTRRQAVDLLCSSMIEIPDNDDDVIQWNPNLEDVLLAELDFAIAQELKDSELIRDTEKIRREAVWRAKGADPESAVTKTAGTDMLYDRHLLKTQRSGHYLSVDS